MELTKAELDIIWEALCYYKDTATHYSEYSDDTCGMNKKDPRYPHIESALIKLQKGG